ncbi:hypothetical protein Tco_0498861 [Tanacetum coccineum]
MSNIMQDLWNILKQHPLRFYLVAYALVPWIYIQQFWHTLKLDDSKEKFKFFIDTKEFKFSVEDFRSMFQLPQATVNNHAAFDEALTFTDMLTFFRDELGYSLPMRLCRNLVYQSHNKLAKKELERETKKVGHF